MQSLIRERFWIIRARKTIKSILNECFICARFKVKSLSSGPSPLPPDRVNDCAIFEVVGIDLAGPLFLKTGEKVWITLFTCAVYRALHLELVNALSSDAFLLALRRFIARRGRPRIIYCDNGTNFRGAFNDLAKLDWHKISRETSTQKIVWKFIPPTAAWWGGWWERLVRIIKELLRRSLGKSILSYEELSTVICDCEFLINSRPLTYISENPQELIPLTPAMFLIENRCSDTTDIDELNSRDLRKRMKYRIKLLSDLRQRFRKEYLSELIQKQNDNRVREPRIGEMVLIGNDNKKRLSWPIAKIIELIPGRDGEIRTVRLKTQHGTVIRPVQRIFPLEVQAIANSDKELKEESISVKSRRSEKRGKIIIYVDIVTEKKETMLLTKRKREDEKQEKEASPKISTSIVLPIRQTASIFKQSVTIVRNQESKAHTDMSHGPQEKPKQVLRIDADKTLRLSVAFQFTECPGTGFQKVSVGVGRRESLVHSVTVNCNSNQSVVAWMHLKNSSHWPCTRRTLLFDQYDVIFLKFGCASCHCLRVCKEEINSDLHFFQKPRFMFCSNSQRSLCLEVEGSSSGTERTSPVRKCEGVSVDMHSMSESLT
ncbi:integrase catalytic domain-containing protein [Trichonephila clavipes]|nr:integrase catalytic domain-containing protein [Trichonephila clavipes]